MRGFGAIQKNDTKKSDVKKLARICEDLEQPKKNDIKNQVSIKIIGFVGFTKFISQDLRGFRATLFSFARL